MAKSVAKTKNRNQICESRVVCIATAYLGLLSETNTINDAISRVVWLVGKQNLETALEGLQTACNRNDLPTPREIARLKVEESKVYFLERIVVAGCLLDMASGRELGELPRETLLCALASLQLGAYSDERFGAKGLEETIFQLLFFNKQQMERFIRDTLEPALFVGENYVSGLYKFTNEIRYSELAGPLALEWLVRSEAMSAQALRNLLEASVKFADHSALSDLIAQKLGTASWPDDEHRHLWLGAAFVVDFERYECDVREFSKEGGETLIILSSSTKHAPPSLSQLVFLIDTYALIYPLIEPPSSGWGSHDPYECARIVADFITKLGEQPTKEAQQALEKIIHESQLGNHEDHARHVLAEHTRTMAELVWAKHTLQGVRQVLLAEPPQSIDDLQGLVIDELEALQKRVRDGAFNGIVPFWNGARPRVENYCRDRLAEHLEPLLERYGVRIHTEGTMPDENRCDLLCSIGEIDLPIEIKGQWHSKVWTAACEQLEDNYSRHYRAEGRGVYLVLWFGDIPNFNPPGIRANGRPDSPKEMLEAISDRSPRNILPTTKLFVLDFSQPD